MPNLVTADRRFSRNFTRLCSRWSLWFFEAMAADMSLKLMNVSEIAPIFVVRWIVTTLMICCSFLKAPIFFTYVVSLSSICHHVIHNYYDPCGSDCHSGKNKIGSHVRAHSDAFRKDAIFYYVASICMVLGCFDFRKFGSFPHKQICLLVSFLI